MSTPIPQEQKKSFLQKLESLIEHLLVSFNPAVDLAKANGIAITATTAGFSLLLTLISKVLGIKVAPDNQYVLTIYALVVTLIISYARVRSLYSKPGLIGWPLLKSAINRTAIVTLFETSLSIATIISLQTFFGINTLAQFFAPNNALLGFVASIFGVSIFTGIGWYAVVVFEDWIDRSIDQMFITTLAWVSVFLLSPLLALFGLNLDALLRSLVVILVSWVLLIFYIVFAFINKNGQKPV